jgi:hypothetical protein
LVGEVSSDSHLSRGQKNGSLSEIAGCNSAFDWTFERSGNKPLRVIQFENALAVRILQDTHAFNCKAENI